MQKEDRSSGSKIALNGEFLRRHVRQTCFALQTERWDFLKSTRNQVRTWKNSANCFWDSTRSDLTSRLNYDTTIQTGLTWKQRASDAGYWRRARATRKDWRNSQEQAKAAEKPRMKEIPIVIDVSKQKARTDNRNEQFQTAVSTVSTGISLKTVAITAASTISFLWLFGFLNPFTLFIDFTSPALYFAFWS